MIYLAGRGGTLFGLWGNSAVSGGRFPILPPGAGNFSRYIQRCIGCQACAAVCPVKIIKPLPGRVLPLLSYDDAYCQFSCVECGKVCPAGAIRELDVQTKRRTRTALSDLKIELCVVVTKGTSCGACAESCPTRAVYMKEQGGGLPTIPVFDERYCIGCGACLVVCPAEPKAFAITPVSEQSLTEGIRPTEGGGEIAPLEEFPF
ncbi:hypothetical protein FACS1894167_15070 [Synergistales bacterium]|nr:hypothetical protein FACS1894167_15070 [Synergistales bacterium]